MASDVRFQTGFEATMSCNNKVSIFRDFMDRVVFGKVAVMREKLWVQLLEFSENVVRHCFTQPYTGSIIFPCKIVLGASG